MPKIVITKENLPRVLSILDKWRGKLTWELYANEVANDLGLEDVSRHTLERYPEIKRAFQLKKAKVKKDHEPAQYDKDSTIEMLKAEILALESKNERLEDKLNKYKEKFVRWQHNMYMMPGVDFEKIENQLDNPLPPVNRSS